MNNEIVLITGTSSGFGFLTTLALAKEGFFVVATMRDLSKIEVLLREAKKQGVEQYITVLSLDVTNDEQLQNIVPYVEEKYGPISILINNAGYCQAGLMEQLEIDDWKRQFQTNFFSAVTLTKAVLPSMRKRRKGKIIFMGSISGRIGLPGMGAYASSKFALEGFVESLRLEVKPFHIDISIIEAGSFETDIWNKSLNNVTTDVDEDYSELLNSLFTSARLTAKRAKNPREVVNLIVHICNKKNAKLRYRIGRGVNTTIFLKNILPWKVIEKFIQQKLK